MTEQRELARCKWCRWQHGSAWGPKCHQPVISPSGQYNGEYEDTHCVNLKGTCIYFEPSALTKLCRLVRLRKRTPWPCDIVTLRRTPDDDTDDAGTDDSASFKHSWRAPSEAQGDDDDD